MASGKTPKCVAQTRSVLSVVFVPASPQTSRLHFRVVMRHPSLRRHYLKSIRPMQRPLAPKTATLHQRHALRNLFNGGRNK